MKMVGVTIVLLAACAAATVASAVIESPQHCDTCRAVTLETLRVVDETFGLTDLGDYPAAALVVINAGAHPNHVRRTRAFVDNYVLFWGYRFAARRYVWDAVDVVAEQFLLENGGDGDGFDDGGVGLLGRMLRWTLHIEGNLRGAVAPLLEPDGGAEATAWQRDDDDGPAQSLEVSLVSVHAAIMGPLLGVAVRVVECAVTLGATCFELHDHVSAVGGTGVDAAGERWRRVSASSIVAGRYDHRPVTQNATQREGMRAARSFLRRSGSLYTAGRRVVAVGAGETFDAVRWAPFLPATSALRRVASRYSWDDAPEATVLWPSGNKGADNADDGVCRSLARRFSIAPLPRRCAALGKRTDAAPEMAAALRRMLVLESAVAAFIALRDAPPPLATEVERSYAEAVQRDGGAPCFSGAVQRAIQAALEAAICGPPAVNGGAASLDWTSPCCAVQSVRSGSIDAAVAAHFTAFQDGYLRHRHVDVRWTT
jgi:hypothetical protein